MYSSYNQGYGDITLAATDHFGEGYLDLPLPKDLTQAILDTHGGIYVSVEITQSPLNRNTLDTGNPAGFQIQTLRYGDWNGGTNFGTYFWAREAYINVKSDISTEFPYIAGSRPSIHFLPIELVLLKKPQGSTDGSTIRLKMAVANCNFDSDYRINYFMTWVGAPL